MLAVFLTAVFLIHALAFGRFYLARERRTFNLLFFLGFVALAAYYGHDGYCYVTGAHVASAWGWIRWVGLGLCATATPFFAASLARRVKRPIGAG